MVTCQKCGAPFSAGLNACSVCGSFSARQNPGTSQAAKGTPGVPWENIATTGIPRGLFRTIELGLLRPSKLFSALAHSRDTTMAWIYALIVGSLGVLATHLWTYLTIPLPLQQLETLGLDLRGTDPLATSLVSAPLTVTVQVVFLAAYCHMMVAMFRRKRQGFSATFRVACYTATGSLLNAVPVVGGLVALVWSFYLLVTGLHHAHDISRIRAFILVTLPLVFLALVMALLVVVAVLSGVVMSGFFKDIFDLLR